MKLRALFPLRHQSPRIVAPTRLQPYSHRSGLILGFAMNHILGVCIAVLGALSLLAPGSAAAQPIDEWHYIDPESVLHTDRVDGLQGAGVIQSDEIFAMLYLGLPDENGVVSVALPARANGDQLSSTLVSTNGQRFERILADEELDVVEINATTFAYSFPITAADVDLFKAAQTWVLQVGEQTWPITLTGSRAAIEEAERKHAALFEQLSTTPNAAKAPATD